MSKKKKQQQEKKPQIENKRVRAAVGRVVAAAILALVLLYLSGISVLTLVFGARSVDERAELSKSAIQSVTGQVLGTYRADEQGTWCAVECKDGVITCVLERKPEIGAEVTATGFVRVLDEQERQDLFAWYDDNGDFANGEDYFDNVSPMYIHDGYGRFFPILPSKIMIACGMVCAIYIILVYMGISSGKYGENK